MATVRPTKYERRTSRSLEDKLQDKIKHLLILASKLYPRRLIDLRSKPGVACSGKVDTYIYQLWTAPIGRNKFEWQLIQEGQLESMRKYIMHELDCHYYRPNEKALQCG
jgi:hypothetical protein